MKLGVKLFLILALIISSSCAYQPKKVNVLYIQTVDGKYTHSYWYSGKLSKSLLNYEAGFISIDQKSINDYLAKDAPQSAISAGDIVPWGIYSIYLDGYCLKGESAKDCVVIYPNRIFELD